MSLICVELWSPEHFLVLASSGLRLASNLLCPHYSPLSLARHSTQSDSRLATDLRGYEPNEPAHWWDGFRQAIPESPWGALPQSHSSPPSAAFAFLISFTRLSIKFIPPMIFVLVSKSRILQYPVCEWLSILLLGILGTCSSTDWIKSIVMSKWIEMPGSSNLTVEIKTSLRLPQRWYLKFTSIQFLYRVAAMWLAKQHFCVIKQLIIIHNKVNNECIFFNTIYILIFTKKSLERSFFIVFMESIIKAHITESSKQDKLLLNKGVFSCIIVLWDVFRIVQSVPYKHAQ